MGSRLRHAFRRTAVSAIVVALPLAAAGTAQAAIAGATPGATLDRPDLVSAHITSLTAPDVQVCFDKAVTLTGTNSSFQLAGYVAGNKVTADNSPGNSPVVDTSNGKCVNVTFSGGGDINNFTTVNVASGAVSFDGGSGSLPNYADSTTLVESTQRSGITGKTAAPNLTGAMTASNAPNSLIYTFDKAVGNFPNNGFQIFDNNDNSCTSSTAAPVSGQPTEVLVTFTCSGPTVSSARVALVRNDFLDAASDTTSFAAEQTTLVAGSSNQPTQPVLNGAALGSNPDTIVYTFDRAVVPSCCGGNNNANDYHAVLSNGRSIAGQSAVTNGNTVTVTFGGNLSPRQEYAVDTWIDDFAVEQAAVSNGNVGNEPTSTPVGDNAGGFGRGFTTAPDVFGVQLNSSNVATVFLDQRTTTGGINPADMLIYPQFGTTAPTAATSAAVASGGTSAGPESVRAQFANGGSLIQFVGCGDTAPRVGGTADGTGAFEATLNGFDNNGTCDSYNIDQIVSPTATAAIAKAYHANAAAIRKHHIRKHRGTRHHRHARRSHKRA